MIDILFLIDLRMNFNYATSQIYLLIIQNRVLADSKVANKSRYVSKCHSDPLVSYIQVYIVIKDYDGIMEAECLYDFTDDGDGCITIRPGMVSTLVKGST